MTKEYHKWWYHSHMWIVFAIGASIFWGITYVLNEQVYKHISVFSSLTITLLVSGVVSGIIAIATGHFYKDLATIFSSQKVLLLVLGGIVMLVLAELCIGFSIANKNATIAGLIEISYPLFIALFSYLLFKESQISFLTAVGGGLIFLGIGIIYILNR